MRINKSFSLLFILCFSTVYLFADKIEGDSSRIKNIPPYDPIVASIDSLINFQFFDTSELLEYDDDVFNFPKDSIPEYPDLVYEYRMAKIDNATPIELDYNKTVKRYIELYTKRKRHLSSKMLGLAKLYFPIFEEKLDKYDLPLELKYLAIVESALNPLARSKSGAVGLWQFMLNSGKMFDLRIDSYVDERRDPFKSTEAACKYLEYLYRTFNDWQLALAAYNGGPGIVRNAILRSGGKTDFWEIRPFLPAETQGYVPAFIAVNYMMSYAREHNLHTIDPKFTYYQTDTVHINQSLHFSQITKYIDVEMDVLKYLNPAYKNAYIPVTEGTEILVLPADKVSDFIGKESDILSYKCPKIDYNTHLANAGDKNGRVKIIHTVKRGEYFHKIAITYGCTIENIKAWNNQKDNSIYTGQQLEIWVNPAHLHRYNLSKSDIVIESNPSQKDYFFYVVQKGDSLQTIATKFKCDSVEELKALNSISGENELIPGIKLKITGANN